MKKLSKVLSVFMAALVVLSSFGVCASAVSSKSTPKELFAYYEKALAKNSAKDLIRSTETYTVWDEYDCSALSGKVLKEVQAEIAEKETQKQVWNHVDYYHGDKFIEEDGWGKSQFCYYFDIEEDIKSYFYVLKSATYTKNADGSEKIVFKCERDPGETSYKNTYTVRISKTGYVTHYTQDRVGTYNVYSENGHIYKHIQHTVDKYTFLCEKVPVTSIELSEKSIELNVMEEKEIQVKLNPSNATFKDFEAHLVGDTSSFQLMETEDGLRVMAINGGVATIVVTDMAENVVATCTVTCKVGFFQRIMLFFKLMYILLLGSLAF